MKTLSIFCFAALAAFPLSAGTTADFNFINQTQLVNFAQVTAPEPGAFGLIGLALVVFGLYRRKPRQNS